MLNPKRNLEIKYVNIFNNLVKKRKMRLSHGKL